MLARPRGAHLGHLLDLLVVYLLRLVPLVLQLPDALALLGTLEFF